MAAARGPCARHGEPRDARTEQHHRQRVVDDLTAEIVEKSAATGTARVVDHLVNELSGRRPRAKLLERVVDAGSRFCRFLLKLLARFHDVASIDVLPTKRRFSHAQSCATAQAARP